MKTKMYSLPPILTIVLMTVALSFAGKYAHTQMADLKCIVAPGIASVPSRKAMTMYTDIDAYRNELHTLRKKQMSDQDVTCLPGCDHVLAAKLALANLHLKYDDLAGEQGYNPREIDKLMCAVDSGMGSMPICHSVKP